MRSIWDSYRSLDQRNPYVRMGLVTLQRQHRAALVVLTYYAGPAASRWCASSRADAFADHAGEGLL